MRFHARRRLATPLFAAPLLAVTLCAPAPVALAQEAEKALEKADAFTVRIKTTIVYPFSHDKRGTIKGAGFVVDQQRGWIATNAHVASRSAASLTVAFRDQEPIRAKRLYVDPFLDLAILQVPREALPNTVSEAKLDCRGAPKAGTPVVAYGHPNGLAFTGTQGIISGVTSLYHNEYLQTDATINPGNSGGPLIRLASGTVTGINTARVADDQRSTFALSSAYLCRIVDLLREGKDAAPPRLNWRLFSDENGARQVKVALPGRAEAALGLKAGDVIASVNGNPMPVNETQVMHQLRGQREVTMTVWRDGKTLTLHGSLESDTPVLGRQGLYISGMLLADPAPEWSHDLNIRAVVVRGVASGSAAEAAEIESSDLLVSIDGRPTPDLASARAVLEDLARNKRAARLVLERISSGTTPERTGVFAWIEAELPIDEVKTVRAVDL